MTTIKNVKILILSCFILPVFSQTVSTISPQFSGSGGVSVDANGNVFVGDYGDALNNANGTQIRMIDQQGSLSLFASGFQGASGNTIAPDGNLFQCNIAGNFVSMVTPNGSVSTYTSQGISSPVGVTMDTAGNLYIANCGNNTVQKVAPGSPSPISTQFSSGSIFSCPNGITIDGNQNLYVSNFNDGSVIKITPTGTASLFATIPGSNNGHLTYSPVYDALFVNSHGSSSIYRVLMNGSVSKVAGSGIRGNLDGPALSASFSRPNGIAFSKTADTLYLNSSVPITNVGVPLNPSLVRMVTGMSTYTGLGSSNSWTRMSVFPNPAIEIISIRLNSPNDEFASLRLMDYLGKSVSMESRLKIDAGFNQIETRLPEGLQPGTYFLILEGSATKFRKRIIVQ